MAHRAGIVHRDLKPSNVLLGTDGTPKISDFGLAKLLGEDSARTVTGEVLGTPGYMAPEQAEGRGREVGPAADIYATGAILYQMLTGRPPFLGASAMETLRLVVSADVVPPRRQRPGVPRDLETIALKCLEKEPGRRYPDAEALADDLRRFLEGRPIAARPVGPAGRLWRWGRRNKVLAATASALVLTFTLGSPALLTLWLQARSDRDRAERSRNRAITAVDALLQVEGEDLRTEELLPYRKALSEAGLRESLALVRDLERDPRAETERLRAYQVMARMQADCGDTAGAEATTRQAIALAEALVARDPADVRARSNLAWSLHRGSQCLRDIAERQAMAERSSELLRSIPAGSPGSDEAGLVTLRSNNGYNIAFYYWGSGRPSEAINLAREVVADCRGFMDRGKADPAVRHMAARAALFLCRVYDEAHREQAVAAGREAEAIFESLVRDHPESYEFGDQLFLAREEIARRTEDARPEEAIRSHEAARQAMQEMIPRHGKLMSRMAAIQANIAIADFNLTCLYESNPARYREPRRAMTIEAHDIAEKLSLVQTLTPNLQFILAATAFARAELLAEDGFRPDLALLLQSERTWAERLLGNPKDESARSGLVVVRRRLAEELAGLGQVVEASAWSRRSLDTVRGDPECLYALAADYARSAELTDTYSIGLNAKGLRERKRRFVDAAIAMLRQAVADGFKDARRIAGDSRLSPIRPEPGFRAILADLEFPVEVFATP